MTNSSKVNQATLKDEASGQGGPSTEVPMRKGPRFNRQINICVDQETFELYYKLRIQLGSAVSQGLREVMGKELQRLAKLVGPA